MRIDKRLIKHYIVPDFKWWKPCWYSFWAVIWLIAVGASVTHLRNISGMQQRGGIVEWVKYDTYQYLESSTYFTYAFKLKNDTTIYSQQFDLENWLIPVVFNFHSTKNSPFCAEGDSLSFRLDNPPKQAFDNFVPKEKRKRWVTPCYGLEVNGKIAFNAMWLFTKTTPYWLLITVFYLLCCVLLLTCAAQFYLVFFTKLVFWMQGDLVREADDCWADEWLRKGQRKDYARAEQLYQQALQKNSHNYFALSMYARMLVEQKRYDEADELYQRMYKIYKRKGANIAYNTYANIVGCEERAAYWKAKC